MENLDHFLKETHFLDYSSIEIQQFVSDFRVRQDTKQLAIELYEGIRDLQLYDPYHLDLRPEKLQSSFILSKKRAWCVEKSILLASCSRALGIPSRMGFAIVKNHLNIEKLIHYLKKDEIVFHGYVSLFIGGKWVRCTPAFDQRVCRISKVSPLIFDGENDSMFQAFSTEGQFMEYLHYYGEFDDLPLDLMRSEMQKHYPHLFEQSYNSSEFSFLY